MTTQLSKSADLPGTFGQEIGTGEWDAITQYQANIFADATCDHQQIHVERAAKGPCGGLSAPGCLALSLCPVFADDVLQVDAVTAAVGCGANRVRFPDTRAREAGTPQTGAGRPRVRVRAAGSAANRPTQELFATGARSR
jgi:MaoC like domain